MSCSLVASSFDLSGGWRVVDMYMRIRYFGAMMVGFLLVKS